MSHAIIIAIVTGTIGLVGGAIGQERIFKFGRRFGWWIAGFYVALIAVILVSESFNLIG